MPRPAKIVLPLLKAGIPRLEGRVYTWNPDVDYRVFPFMSVRRLGGARNKQNPLQLSTPVIELTAYTDEGEPETEQLYEDALEVLYEAVRRQTQTEYGYLHSMKENMGAMQFSSLFADSWRVQGLIQLGIRPPRSHS